MKKNIAFLSVLLLSATLSAKLAVDTVFSSNMVLQQEKPIAFFGTAKAAAPIAVTFAGRTVSCQSDSKGNWRAEFPAMKAGSTSYTATIKGDGGTVQLNDLLIGEVWFCSGQSNMAMPIGKKFRRGWSARDCEKEVAAACYPEIRYAYQRLCYSHTQPYPASYSRSKGWVKCSPETAHYFSAASYFFGRKLHQDLKIPVGLINASWGGTKIEPWISDAGYQKFGPASDYELVRRFQLSHQEKKSFEQKKNERYMSEHRAWYPSYAKLADPKMKEVQNFFAPDFDDSKWEQGNNRIRNTYNTRLFRTRFLLPPDLKGKDLLLSDGKIGDVTEIYLNGQKIGGWNADSSFHTKYVRISLKADQLHQDKENVLAVRGDYFRGIRSNWEIRYLIRKLYLKSKDSSKRHYLTQWKQLNILSCTAKETGTAVPANYEIPYRNHQFPGNLYKSMVHAWTRLPVRGVIWYQGCSNAGNPHYYLLHKTLISDWRERWNNPEMPFLIVQLAGFAPANAKNWKTVNPNQKFPYALTRDIQQQMLKIRNVGLATAIDIGEVKNIHPANKQDLGFRLGLEAERIAYGKNIVSRGPLFQKAVPEGKAIRVFFDNCQNGLKTSDGQKPGAFAVAGADKKFVWADARIDGKTVVVSSPKIPAPKFVRYAYAGYRGDCNLQNADNLPAYPFRSDAYDYSKVK